MTDVERTWFGTAAAARYTGRPARKVAGAARSGELVGYQQAGAGGNWHFRRDDLDRWMRGEKPRRRDLTKARAS